MADRSPLVRTELVEIPVTAYAPLPPTLTEPLPAPPPPAYNCVLPDGRATVCALDALLHQEQWQTLRQRANEDRATSALISLQASFQPGVKPSWLDPRQRSDPVHPVANRPFAWPRLTTSDPEPAR